MRHIKAQIEALSRRLAINFNEYKKEHPGTKKLPSDKIFKATHTLHSQGYGSTPLCKKHAEDMKKSLSQKSMSGLAYGYDWVDKLHDSHKGKHCAHCQSNARQNAYKDNRITWTVKDKNTGKVTKTKNPKEVPWRGEHEVTEKLHGVKYE